MELIHDAVEAVKILRELGYSHSLINFTLKYRWYDEDGLITESELRDYFRINACTYLMGYRAFRHSNPPLAASQMRRYRACKEELKWVA